ncbi:sulfite exporter TauE/SafE family protein [Halomonas elongata]|uniref:Probable membrane transporter protein n=1 Tax=Halomonas elongata (strain ATCC 33173 / DSM 2581 / NBRC 15536 / NCIMB 2198 / 1H9) TaxID=768066 RepID=E1V7W7_HALED|nr:sulfite exporter TauE/SafE family protein [Halomonas elongata]WBF18768.1 sulfite exporter TauE/SafE family protein [Halomonas elongata]WPU47624.1 sulfite exporter TauE/SafE family protein [Halomonas elongata DSM 2581]CBV41530.1 UPF0721 family protein [Halomonas elongata DSM 2581]
MYLLLLACGGLAGVTTVLFGFGGGFFMVPLLYAVLLATHGADSAVGQVAMHIAVATSTSVMIVGAGLATRRHHRAGTLDWRWIRPLVGYIAIGAIAGAATAMAMRGDWVRWAFIAYLAITILDALLRPGFLAHTAAPPRTPSNGAMAVFGLGIGMVAALLGVGGSVMTVPLMRRRGLPMARATAMATPLSLPMALAGTAAYMLLARGELAVQGPWQAGYVDLRALAALAAGSWIGIRLASPWIGRLPDGIHARAYLALLAGVLATMVAL